MAAGDSSHRKSHVAVFAFPYGTHATPLLNLTVKLARDSPHVTFFFFTTQQSKLSLLSSSKFTTKIPHNINFFAVSDGIPAGIDISDHPFSRRLDFFLQAGPQNLKQSLDMAVSESGDGDMSLMCVISDAFVASSLAVAREYGVPWIALWTSYTCSLSAHLHTHLIRDKFRLGGGDKDGSLAFINPSFSKFRAQDLPETIILKEEEEEEEQEESTFSKVLASMGSVLPEAEAVVVNFYEELDPPEMVQDLRSKIKSLIYAGFLNLSLPLPPPPPATTDESGSLRWLDEQSPKSLVYISLGTVVSPPPHELAAIAEALEELEGVPFLWSLKEDSKAFLPKGFVERTSKKGKGKVVPWAPQSQVLSHDSVGVFVTHGGCNSVSESLSCGVPMICRPYFGDQLMAARMVEDVWEVGVKIEGGVFKKDGLIRSLEVVLKGEEGKVMRKKAEELKKVVIEAAGQNGKSVKEFQKLVEIIS